MQKKFIIYGEFWEGTLPSLLQGELLGRGYNVKIFDYTNIIPGIKNREIFGRIKRRIFIKIYEIYLNVIFLKYIEEESPDFIVISKGLNLWPSTIKSIASSNSKVINWNPDDFFNIKNTSKNLMESFQHYDVIISSRRHLFEKYLECNAKSLIFIDWYYVPELHFPRVRNYKYQISFVGSWSPYREFFISKLKKPVNIWGGGWDKSSIEFREIHNVNIGSISQVEMSLIYSSSKFNLNILTHENSDLSNLRFFEVCASRGLLVTERNESSLQYLKDQEDCLMYANVDDVNLFLDQEFDFEKIANSGYKKITSGGNSFSDRVDQLIEQIS